MATDFFFFNDTATTEIYTLSLHDALPISWGPPGVGPDLVLVNRPNDYHRDHRYTAQLVLDATYLLTVPLMAPDTPDRKSTRLNSSHANISYAVFCLKKKKRPTAHVKRLSW